MKLLPALEFEVHGKTMDLWMRIFKLVPCPIWLMYAHEAAYDIDHRRPRGHFVRLSNTNGFLAQQGR